MPGVVYERYFVNERTSAVYTAILKDENGVVIPKDSFETFELWLFEKTQKTIINNRGTLAGPGQNVLVAGSHGVTIHNTSGLLTWQISTLDTKCVLTTPPATPIKDEVHVAVFKATWSSGSKGFTHQFEIVITDMIPEVNP